MGQANGFLVLAIPTSGASRTVGSLLALTAILGIVILAADQVLPSVPAHYSALVAFVIIDFVIAGFVLAKPSKMSFTLAAGWSALRILLQFADVTQGPGLGMTYNEFADYLFDPLATNTGNPMGVPALLIDLMIILEAAVISLAWKARSSSK
jgi:hypothetical protein